MGQSTRSVIIASIGKMTDFLSTYGLLMPIQYVVMIYFSSSVNYVNVIQVVWFHGRKPNFSRDEPPGTVQYNEFRDGEVDESSTAETNLLCSSNSGRPSLDFKTKRAIQYSLITLLTCFLGLFAYGIVWATDSYYAIVAPCTLVAVTFSLSCCIIVHGVLILWSSLNIFLSNKIMNKCFLFSLLKIKD